MNKRNKKIVIGWKEWFNLECLDLYAIKAKIDTGAKTSALHAFNIESFYVEDVEYVRFEIHPLQKNKKLVRSCVARVVDRRMVCDSGGKKEKRYVIESNLRIENYCARVEITLTNRDSMTFRMLLGREALKVLNMNVDVAKSFVLGSLSRSRAMKLYQKNKPQI
jgi:ribosomal protein S6--L-glutamate ligase